MHDLVKWMAAAALSVGASIGTAAAADVPTPYTQPRYSQPQPPPPDYYPPQPQERYGYQERYQERYSYEEPPPAYAYPPAPPPPPAYNYYEPAPVVTVVPPPVYSYPYYPYRRHYAFRPFGPRVVYAPYGHPRPFRRW